MNEICQPDSVLDCSLPTEAAASEVVPLLFDIDLEQLMRKHGRRLRHFIRRRVHCEADVDDLVQDTYIAASKGLARFEGRSKPETWLFSIALNMTRAYHRSRSRRPVFEPEEMVFETPAHCSEDLCDKIARRQEIANICKFVEELPETHRVVFMLVVHEEKSFKQVAMELQIPENTVKTRIFRIRALLKAERVTTGG